MLSQIYKKTPYEQSLDQLGPDGEDLEAQQSGQGL